MNKFTKDHAATHAENRFKLCFLCLGQTKVMIPIKGALKTRLNNLFDVDTENDRLPAALCSTCKRDLYRATSQNDEFQNRYKKRKLPDFSKFKGADKVTRSIKNKKCFCHLCELARGSDVYFGINKILPSKKRGSSNKEKKAGKLCSKCFSTIGRGK